MKKSLFLLFLLFTFLIQLQFAFAQTLHKSTDTFKEIQSVQSLQRGEQMFFAGSENDKSVIINALNKDLVTLWRKHITGHLISLHNLENTLLFLVSTDFSSSKGPNNTIKAYTLDPKTGNIKAQKTILTDDDQFLITQRVIISKDQRTFSLVSRKTLTKRIDYTPVFVVTQTSESDKFVKELNTTSSFTISSFNQNLDAIGKVSPTLPPGDVIDVVKASNNDIFIATAQGNTSVIIAKYEAGKENSSEVITEPFTYSAGYKQDRLYKLLHLTSDSAQNNIVYLGGILPNQKSSICIFNKYNFKSKEHKRFSKSITKEDIKVIEKNYKPITKEFKSLDLGDAETLHLLRVLESENGFLLVLSDTRFYPRTDKADGFAFRTDNSGRTTYSPGQVGAAVYRTNTFPAYGLMIYSLDKELNFKAMSTVPRLTDLAFQPEFNAWHKGTNWYVLATSGFYSECIMAKLNDVTGNVEEIKAIKPSKVSQKHYASLNQGMFTNQRIIIPLRAHKLAWGRIEFDLDIHQFNWQLLKE